MSLVARPTQVLPLGPNAPSPTARPDTLFEFHVSSPLPTVDLSRTLVGCLSSTWQARIVAFMSAHYKRLAILQRIASLAYFLLLVLPPSGLRHAITVLVCCSLAALTCTTVFLSLDALALLLRTHEVVFISVINALNWCCLALMLGDFRVIICVPSWFAAQVAIFIDANFRTFPTVQRSIMIAIPAILSVALCCALDKIHDPKRRAVTVGSKTLSLANVITFTSSTLTIFLLKKAVLKHKRSSSSTTGLHVIPCVLLRAKLELRPVDAQASIASPPVSEHDQLQPVESSSLSSPVQPLHLSKRVRTTVDATHCLARVSVAPLSWWWLGPLYATGVSGFVCLLARSSLGAAFASQSEGSQEAFQSFIHIGDILSYAGLASTLVFCGTFAIHFQRDLVRMLLRNFDYLFSSFQVVVMTICLGDLYPNRPADAVFFVAWAVWYQWMLTLDALPPPMKAKFRFRKRFAAPVVVAFLAGGAWMLGQLFFENDIDMANRVLFEYRVSSTQRYRLTTIGVLVERLLTVLGWLGSRLVVELLSSNEHQLLFVRGLVEYTSPFQTFPPTSAARKPQAGGS